jgi:hypothetical protein
MPFLRGNLHAHTTYSDGHRAPAELVAEYETRGYDFLAVTDHEDKIPPGYWKMLETLSSRMVLFHGIELNYWEYDQHVGKVLGDRETLFVLNHPARYKLSVEQAIARTHEIRAAGLPLDAIEITDTGLYRPLYDTDRIPLARIATDDAHRPPHFGRAWVEVEAPRDRDAIIRAIRAGDFQVAFAQPSLV